jgi:hypothetical protein
VGEHGQDVIRAATSVESNGRGWSVVTEERTDEVRTVLATLRAWAQGRPDVVAVGLAGSWARGDARMDSDVNVVLLTEEDRAPYLEDDAWAYEMGGVGLVWTRRWGTATERSVALPAGLEVELVVAHPSWAATDPVDEGTRRVAGRLRPVGGGRRIQCIGCRPCLVRNWGDGCVIPVTSSPDA